ncbi:MAG: signal peptidase II [Hyphomicrobiales bacterium]|nr:signal peptidase II [Hyphomicrobiales bacterium]MBV8662175.1 signal peptidase II [Hyphomicrobiales bacterium]
MRTRALGGAAILAALALDQATKYAVVRYFDAQGGAPFALGPFLNFTLRWNPGVSFSLFAQDTAAGRWMLLAVTAAVTVFLAVWLWRARSVLTCLGLGAIIGGALGNAYDRFAYGAVADFLDLHLGARHFFVFNGADAAINIGVVLLILDGLFLSGRTGLSDGRR